MDMDNKVNCLKCKHYTITWNPKFPNACKLLGFKSATMPSVVAYESTGKMCEAFERKDGKKSGANKNPNDIEQSVIVSLSSKQK